jgi:hypothetical protein
MAGSAYVVYKYFWERNALKDFTNKMIVSLSMLDFVASLMYSIGDGITEATSSHSDACVVQGFFIEWFALSTVIFNSCIAFNLYSWVVKRDNQKALRRRFKYYIAISLGLPFFASVGLAAEGALGDATREFSSCVCVCVLVLSNVYPLLLI